jgi:uncharacterized protein YecT (DUF1311 family)
VTRSAILEHASAKERDASAPAVDFCTGIGGTTLTIDECVARDRKNTETRRELAAKGAVATLDAAGKALFAASETAHAAYVEATGDFVYEVYVQGSIRNAMSLSARQALAASRATDLAAFPRFVAKATSPAQVEAARRASAAALRQVAASLETPAEKDALEKAQRAWATYRDAEIALYVSVFGPGQGADRVRAAVLARLESRRASECAPPSAGP